MSSSRKAPRAATPRWVAGTTMVATKKSIITIMTIGIATSVEGMIPTTGVTTADTTMTDMTAADTTTGTAEMSIGSQCTTALPGAILSLLSCQ
eukprot:CAMPEP_0170463496 /NCGR_PEP_ID=MMETSP0123-20130129/8589_1 /TAXON_ID=182087 /ORGANISM="Favella ehrenbergii, Strain Fehren 1" /LENGTH=92 /DNA_ID=CAMNT_0010728949 /DNA_START=252 /DNA_END=530 /DNA_ORIENTATION=-